jgi:hypothetical protein
MYVYMRVYVCMYVCNFVQAYPNQPETGCSFLRVYSISKQNISLIEKERIM